MRANLRRRRLEDSATLDDYARSSGLSRIYISQLERGIQVRPKRGGTLAKLALLAQCYGVQVSSLLACMRKG